MDKLGYMKNQLLIHKALQFKELENLVFRNQFKKK